tara:strand:+ start:4945 stop:5457 length:513 start_codon:yes stop_codon:yes gene_type:complete
MGIKTNNVSTGLTKKEKIAQLKIKHDKVFEKLGIINPIYIPKMAFGTPLSLAFFPSEFKDEKDIYTELVSRDYDSEDETRTLYKWKYNSNWDDPAVYSHKPFGHSSDVMHLIPLDELTPIVIDDDDADEFQIPDPDQDSPISELTIRDLAAMLTGKPVSMKPWLNKIMKG